MTPRKPTQDGKDPAIAWAEKLFKQLHTDLLGAQTAIIEIIKAKAWETLGYETLAKAWIDKMSDISIRVELAPHVIYALLDEAIPVDEIADMVKGVGPETIENFAREKQNGVPANDAKGRRPGTKKGPAYTLFLHPGREDLAAWREYAAKMDRNLEDLAVEVLRDYFRQS